jgi:hypothetical protein
MNTTLLGSTTNTNKNSRLTACDLEKCTVSNMMIEVSSSIQEIKDCTFTNCLIIDGIGDVKRYNKLINCEYKDLSI